MLTIKKYRRSGFTLTEMIVVIAVLATLSALTAFSYSKVESNTKTLEQADTLSSYSGAISEACLRSSGFMNLDLSTQDGISKAVAYINVFLDSDSKFSYNAESHEYLSQSKDIWGNSFHLLIGTEQVNSDTLVKIWVMSGGGNAKIGIGNFDSDDIGVLCIYSQASTNTSTGYLNVNISGALPILNKGAYNVDDVQVGTQNT